jgi:hypothetical protein
MIAKADFVPRQATGPGFFREAEYESFAAALHAANEFVSSRSLKVLNVETVVLPNVWDAAEQGTTDPSI